MEKERPKDFDELSVSEQIIFVQKLWDRIAHRVDEDIEVTASQRRELDRRLEAFEQDPNNTIAWEDVHATVSGPDRKDDGDGE